MSTPAPANSPSSARPSNRTFWLLLALFIIPYALAWFFYQNPALQQQLGRKTNTGTLITPVLPIGSFNFQRPDQTAFTASGWQNQWSFLVLMASSCAQPCQDNLYKIRQIRLALGEDRQHLQRVAVLVEPATALLDQLRQDYPDMVVLTATPPIHTELASRLGDWQDRIFLVDPAGQVMMTYPPQTDAKGILKDVQRLLKVLPPQDKAYKH